MSAFSNQNRQRKPNWGVTDFNQLKDQTLLEILLDSYSNDFPIEFPEFAQQLELENTTSNFQLAQQLYKKYKEADGNSKITNLFTRSGIMRSTPIWDHYLRLSKPVIISHDIIPFPQAYYLLIDSQPSPLVPLVVMKANPSWQEVILNLNMQWKTQEILRPNINVRLLFIILSSRIYMPLFLAAKDQKTILFNFFFIMDFSMESTSTTLAVNSLVKSLILKKNGQVYFRLVIMDLSLIIKNQMNRPLNLTVPLQFHMVGIWNNHIGHVPEILFEFLETLKFPNNPLIHLVKQ